MANIEERYIVSKEKVGIVLSTGVKTHVVTNLQTSCNKSVDKLSTSCVRTACS